MHPVLFRLPIIDWPLHTYGVLIVCGFLLAMFVGWKEARRHDLDLGEEVLDFGFWALLGGMVGARIVFIIVNWETYAANPSKIFVFWEGGLVFYGAAIGGTAAFFWFARRRGYNTSQTLFLADVIIVGVPLAHVFGRFGCVAAGCCWGQEMWHLGEAGQMIADIPLAAQFPPESLAYQSQMQTSSPEVAQLMKHAGHTVPLFPSQLAESFGESLVFLTLLLIRSRKWFHGQVILSYGMLYAVLRFTLEFFRGDAERGMAVLSTSQFISLGVAAFCFWAIFTLRKKGLAQIGTPVVGGANTPAAA